MNKKQIMETFIETHCFIKYILQDLYEFADYRDLNGQVKKIRMELHFIICFFIL